jgi:hypothetical protein
MPEAAGMRRALMILDPCQRKYPALRYAEEKGVNMDITFACDKCGQQVVIDEAGAGIQVSCPGCGQSLIVPSQEPRQPELVAQPGRGLIETVKIGIGILFLVAIVAALAVRHTSWWERHRVVAQAREQLVAALGGHPDTVSECDQIAATWAPKGTLTKVDVYRMATTMALDKDKLFRKRVADSMLYGTPSLQGLLNEENQALGPAKFCAELQWRCQSASNKRHGLPPPPRPKSLAPPPSSGTDNSWLTK